MTGERCPQCKKALVGLYYNYRNKEGKPRPKRKAYYCKYCDLVLKDNEIVYKIIKWETIELKKVE